jgi:hypothetical protein
VDFYQDQACSDKPRIIFGFLKKKIIDYYVIYPYKHTSSN